MPAKTPSGKNIRNGSAAAIDQNGGLVARDMEKSLLVGSVPADSNDQRLRAVSECCGCEHKLVGAWASLEYQPFQETRPLNGLSDSAITTVHHGASYPALGKEMQYEHALGHANHDSHTS